MKWWAWMILGVFVMAVTTMIGWAMYKREKRGNLDSLEKARQAKADKAVVSNEPAIEEVIPAT